jgi:hypothetical protein
VEYNKTEVEVLENAVAEGRDEQVRELTELQLALVGGGHGEAIFA